MTERGRPGTGPGQPGEPDERGERATTLLACAALVGLESLGLLVAAAAVAVELAVSSASDPLGAAVLAGLALVAGLGLALAARGLARRGRWARAPALVSNLILLPVGYGLVQSGRWYAGLPVMAIGLAVLVLLFHPATNAALDDD
ncbi:MAG TPA: hypothetical protein VH857_06000 [Actinomycetes bacterium]|nr:hypothetical protein [Actinomycetes bacterium]